MALIRPLTVSTIALERKKEELCGFRQTVKGGTSPIGHIWKGPIIWLFFSTKVLRIGQIFDEDIPEKSRDKKLIKVKLMTVRNTGSLDVLPLGIVILPIQTKIRTNFVFCSS